MWAGYDEDSISPEAVDLIKKLLHPDSNKRLGANGVEEIKSHAFFTAHSKRFWFIVSSLIE